MIFSEYMNRWLYGENGYYENYKEIGKKGDFYTSVSSSQFFGGSIAKYIINLIDSGKLENNITICEIGAHKGYLLADIIQFIYTLKPHLLETLSFAIIEKFDKLRDKQKQYLKDSFGNKIKIDFFNSLNNFKVQSAFFIANEIFDAFPCELYFKGKIANIENHKIEFNQESSKITNIAKKYKKDRGEFPIGYKNFGKELIQSANKFEFLTFDYGDLIPRFDFSIRIYSKHQVFPLFEKDLNIRNFYQNSDITYDVHFQYLIDEFKNIGINFIDFQTQANALIEFGIIELLELLKNNVSDEVYINELNRVKLLITFLGERFKMVKFRKGF